MNDSSTPTVLLPQSPQAARANYQADQLERERAAWSRFGELGYPAYRDLVLSREAARAGGAL